MASSLIAGTIQAGWPTERIVATATRIQRLAPLASAFGIQTTTDNQVAVKEADIVVLAVKPAAVEAVVAELSPLLQEVKPVLVSVAAGVSVAALERYSGGGLAIVRCMPNTPVQVQHGVSGLFANEQARADHKNSVERIMAAIGQTFWVASESDIDRITAVSGSGPAYFLLFMEAMIAAGKGLGLPEEKARAMVIHTALGTALMAAQSGDVADLRRRVTSPGGTTEQALRVFQENGLDSLVDKAMTACRDHATRMTV